MTNAAEQLSFGFTDPPPGLPAHVEPMRARPVGEPFDSPDYVFETRWNGIRALASLAGGRLSLRSRRLGVFTNRFPELAVLRQAAAEQPLLLDGEIVIVDERGRANIDAAQWRLRLLDQEMIEAEATRHPACFLVSDILFRGQRWLIGEPLQRRKKILAETVHQSECVYLAEVFESEGRALFQAAVESDLEGIIAKPKDSVYTPGSFGGWLTVGRDRAELVIGGYSMQIAGGSRTIELLLGGYDAAGQLMFVMSVQPPSDDTQRNELFAVLNALQIDQPPFAENPPFIACWTQPELVVTVSFSRRQGQDEMRFPVLERVRVDVSPDDCLLPVDAPSSERQPRKPPRPQLTMLTTLPLPLDAAARQPPDRPPLRLLDGA